MSIKLCILVFFIIAVRRTLSAIDPQFQSCVPKSCGKGPNISFPFYIQDLQTFHCGLPGFKIVCNTFHQPALYTSSKAHYIVDDIFYKNKSIRVRLGKNIIRQAGVDVYYPGHVSKTCSPPEFNFTVSGSPFSISPKHQSIFFLSECPSLILGNLTSYELNCSADHTVLVMFGKDPNFDYASKECRYLAETPVEIGGNGITGNMEKYKEALTTGFQLSWSADNNCGPCKKSGGRCGFDESLNRFRCFCQDGSQDFICVRRSSRIGIKIALVASFAGIGIVALALSYCFWRKFIFIGMIIIGKRQTVEAFLGNQTLAIKRYNYSCIKKMTNSFEDKLGQGGYGDVYKGTLKDGRLVAVKLLTNSKCNKEEFINEVASICSTSHVNIVKLLGFCFERSKGALIYEFMPNGSLEKFMYDEQATITRNLGWDRIYKICLGIARGLEYLHYGCNTRILHFDIKPHNILLDEDFCPKISDFGLARICPSKESVVSMQGARGTVGYMAPEVFYRNLGGVSYKSDVYSYGIMILEMAGGKIIKDVDFELSSEMSFQEWMYNQLKVSNEIGLTGIISDEENEIARKIVLVGLWCIQNDPSSRPPISRVVDMLEGNLNSLQVPPRPFLSSPSKSLEESSNTASTTF